VSYFSNEYSYSYKWQDQYRNATGDDGPVPFPIPDRQEAENDFRKAVDKISRVMRELAGSHYTATARSLEPIKFNGSNKIVAIAVIHDFSQEERDKRGHYHEVETVYGKLPQEFMTQWQTSVGEFHVWKNR
jgi:hypothetical protein